mgnify:CR=1 FL=1
MTEEIAKRCSSAFIGVVSGTVVGFLLAFGVSRYVWRKNPGLLLFCSPPVFGLIMGVWGFFDSEGMLERLEGLWERFYDH